MAQAELRRRMRSADAMFLYFEKRAMPLHIGSVAILDGRFDAECERMVESRLPEIPRYRQRVMFPPFNLTHPAWEFDPDFDIRNHIRHVRLPAPGDEHQLSELSGRVFTDLMDRSKPLWDLTVVDGLQQSRSALIARVHHCLVDGVSGVGLMKIMFDTSRTPRAVEPRPYHPPPLPEPAQLLVEGLAGLWSDSVERLLGAQLAVMRFAQGLLADDAGKSLATLLSLAPELLRPAERLPFNGPCSGVRGHCWTTFSFAEARMIRAALGGTINDVALTAVAGAVSRYVLAHREPVKGRFVRIMVPVNLRTDDARGPGNEISMLPMSIPLDIKDPAGLMKEVTARSLAMKSARVADLIALIGSWLGWTPPMMQNSLGALPFLPQPVLLLNMVCTNVPGPMTPLYVNGRELLTYYPHVPIGSDIGIGVAIHSYNQKLHFGITYDGQAAPDGELFRDLIVESYEELRAAAGVPSVAPLAVGRSAAASTGAVRSEELRSHRRADAPPAAETSPPAVVEPVPPAEAETEAAAPAHETAAAPAPVEMVDASSPAQRPLLADSEAATVRTASAKSNNRRREARRRKARARADNAAAGG
jgi:diacylglycerol O-acyltransferase